MKRHLVLLGLPGTGKTTVGRVVAERLGAGFDDLDLMVERQAGRSIPDIFAREGEPAFRHRERDAMLATLERPARVIAAGGGWAAEPGNLDATRGRALTIYLSCTPETAAGRTAGSAGRPLLAADRLPGLRELLARRHAFYSQADAEVRTDGRDPEGVAADVVALARSHGGW